MTDETDETDETGQADETAPSPDSGSRPAWTAGPSWLVHRWSRRATVWAVGVAALVVCGSAVAVVANTGHSSPRPELAADSSSSAPRNALDAIIAGHPDLGKPVSALIDQGTLPKATYQGDTGTVGVPVGTKKPRTAVGGAAGFVPGPANGAFTLVQMASLALSQGCSAAQAPIAGAIGAAESGGNPGAQGDISLMDGTWDWSEGIWQIRGLRAERGTGALRDSLANADPVTNAKAMYAISSGCTNWTPWSTYNTGAYLAYLPYMKDAVYAATKYRTETGSYPPLGPGAVASVPSAVAARSTRPSAHRSSARPAKSSVAAHRSTATTRPAAAATTRPAAPHSSSVSRPPGTSAVPTKKPSLPVTLPSVPTSTPSLPVKLPTSVTVPPLPSLSPLPTVPGLPGLP